MPGLGPGGRAFESHNPDQMKTIIKFLPIFLLVSCIRIYNQNKTVYIGITNDHWYTETDSTLHYTSVNILADSVNLFYASKQFEYRTEYYINKWYDTSVYAVRDIEFYSEDREVFKQFLLEHSDSIVYNSIVIRNRFRNKLLKLL